MQNGTMTIPSVNDINNQGFYVPYDPKDESKGRQGDGSKGGLRDDFMWGFATASAQIEGGGKEKEEASGRGRSVSCLLPIVPTSERIRSAGLTVVDLGYAVRPTWRHQGWLKGVRHVQSPRAVQGGSCP